MLVACAAALETRLPQTAKARVQVILATTGAQSVLDERVTDPSAALPLGPVLSLPAELPGLTMRAVDLPPAAPTAQAAWLVREARAGVAGAEIAWRGGRRWLRRYDPMEPEAGTIIPRHRGVILITGGLSGIGLALAVRLARAHEARLLLTGRRALPPRTTWDHAPPPWARAAIAAIRDIESAGGEVITAHADATDAEAMQAAIATATARWGPLNGVIHAAGNPGAGKLTLLQTEADLAATLAPKLGGLSVLTDLLANAELDFVALTSSLNAVVPVAGAGDYAAANLVLDRFAEAGPHPPGWRHVVAIAWGAWAEIGMAARLAASRAPQAAPSAAAIPPDTGLDLFFRILASGRNRVVVTCDDRPRLLATAAEPASSPNPPPPSPAPAAPQPHETAGHARPALSTRHEPPTGAMEQTLAAIWTDLIGVTGIGANDDFFELGGHSLLATRVLARIGQTLDVRLTLRDLFDAPTIRTLRQKIDAALTPPDREEFLL
jgi:NAD(P)-dependent dehydrogenase (short-subunit alcohol dehydrogenase family)